MGKNIYSGKPG